MVEKYVLVKSVAMLKDVLSRFKGSVVAFDTETTGLNPVSDKLVGISFCFENDVKAYYIPLAHVGYKDNLPLDVVVLVLQKFFNGDVRLVFHNFKFDYKFLKRVGFSFDNVDIFDTMVCAYLINAESRKYSLAYLVKRYFGYDMLSFDVVTGLYGGAFECVPVNDAVFYACEDSFYTVRLYGAMLPQVTEFRSLLYDVEFPLIPVLADMEDIGFSLDVKRLSYVLGEVKAKLAVLEREIYDLTGCIFNIRSNKQLGQVLVDLGVSVRHTRKRSIKVDSVALREYAVKCTKVLPIIEYKKLSHLVSSFLMPLLDGVIDGKIHCNFNQCMVRTGRLSCSSPNLQNIPKATDFIGLIRSCFVPLDSSSVILCADYSQIELRILAVFSGESVMLNAFSEGEDLHEKTARLLLGVVADTVSEEERFKAKVLNFMMVYGVQPFSLSRYLDVSYSEAVDLLKAFFVRFSRLRPWMNVVIDFAFENGFVFTLLKRCCWIPFFAGSSGNSFQRGFAKRQAVNSVIQGSCADLIKKAMVDVVKRLRSEGLNAKLLLQVHDELVFSVPDFEVERTRVIVRDCLENVVSLSVPLVVDVGVGKNWFEAKKEV